jgi:hypothetical protein
MAIQNKTLVAVFKDPLQAQQAIKDLRCAGFPESKIGIISKDGPAWKETKEVLEKGRNMEKGAAIGALAGAGIGGLWGLGITAGLLPAIGPVIAGGVLASLLASAAGGSALGGALGTYIGGISEDKAEYYENELKAGNTLVIVQADDRYREAEAIFKRLGAYDFSSPSTPPYVSNPESLA